MWIVFDYDAKPGAELARHDGGESVIVETVEEAIEQLSERICFTLGYINDPDGNLPTPPLPKELKRSLEVFVENRSNLRYACNYLRYDSKDGYAHVLMELGSFRREGIVFRDLSL